MTGVLRMPEQKKVMSKEERFAKMADLQNKLAELENTLDKHDAERSLKVQAWKKKTNELIAS